MVRRTVNPSDYIKIGSNIKFHYGNKKLSGKVMNWNPDTYRISLADIMDCSTKEIISPNMEFYEIDRIVDNLISNFLKII